MLRKESVCSRPLCQVRQGPWDQWAVSALLWRSQTIKKLKSPNLSTTVNISLTFQRLRIRFWPNASALKIFCRLWECRSLEAIQKFTWQISLELSLPFLAAWNLVTSRSVASSFRILSVMNWVSKKHTSHWETLRIGSTLVENGKLISLKWLVLKLNPWKKRNQTLMMTKVRSRQWWLIRSWKARQSMIFLQNVRLPIDKIC